MQERRRSVPGLVTQGFRQRWQRRQIEDLEHVGIENGHAPPGGGKGHIAARIEGRTGLYRQSDLAIGGVEDFDQLSSRANGE